MSIDMHRASLEQWHWVLLGFVPLLGTYLLGTLKDNKRVFLCPMLFVALIFDFNKQGTQ